jgi:hypothetical protein
MTDSPKQGPARIVVRIDELVLHGVAPGDRHAIADAVRGAITRQLQQAGPSLPWSITTNIERIDAGECRPASSGASALGASIGETIYRGMSTWPAER